MYWYRSMISCTCQENCEPLLLNATFRGIIFSEHDLCLQYHCSTAMTGAGWAVSPTFSLMLRASVHIVLIYFHILNRAKYDFCLKTWLESLLVCRYHFSLGDLLRLSSHCSPSLLPNSVLFLWRQILILRFLVCAVIQNSKYLYFNAIPGLANRI